MSRRASHLALPVLIALTASASVISFAISSRPSRPAPAPTAPAPTAPAPPAPAAASLTDLAPRRNTVSRLESLRPGEPLPRSLPTPAGVRFVSIMLIEDEPFAEDPESSAVPEPSDLDDDHPGAYWSNAGFTSLRAVAGALGIEPRAAWVESASGELLFEIPGASAEPGASRLVSVSPDPVPADLTGDARADLKDLAMFLEWLGEQDAWADLDENGRTDSADLVRYLSMWSISG